MRLMPLLILLLGLLGPAPAIALNGEEMVRLLKVLDDRQRNSGDYKAMSVISQKEKDKNDQVYEAVIYRRDEDDKLMILFVSPKSEAGKGYLRLDKNLWLYDPTTGKWERRTDRESIGGTGSRRTDFDESRLAEEFTPTYIGEEKLGKYAVHHLKLNVKEGTDVAYPIQELWVDKGTENILKRQEFALSGRLMRTSLYPQWEKLYSESKKDMVYYPRRILIYDEVEKENQTQVQINEIDLRSLPGNIFTKAWLESKSR